MKKFFEGAAITFAVGLVIFLVVLLITSWPKKADAAEPVITPIDSCLDGWFWKASSGTPEKEVPPSLTPDGLLFNDQDTVNAVLAWHLVEPAQSATILDSITGDKWSMVDFAQGAPGPNSAFKLSTSPWTGTWNYMGPDHWVRNNIDFTTASAKSTIGDAQIVEFGMGTDTTGIDQPGWTVERVHFAGEAYSLKCVPEVIVSTVPGPVVTQVRTVIVTPSVSASVAPSPSVTVTPTPSRTTVVPVAPAGNSGSSDGNGFPWKEVGIGGALVAAGGATLAAMAVARRRNRQSSEPEAPEYDEAMREFDAALESLHPDSGAEGPGKHSVDNAPTQAIPYVDNGDAETETLPRQE